VVKYVVVRLETMGSEGERDERADEEAQEWAVDI